MRVDELPPAYWDLPLHDVSSCFRLILGPVIQRPRQDSNLHTTSRRSWRGSDPPQSLPVELRGQMAARSSSGAIAHHCRLHETGQYNYRSPVGTLLPQHVCQDSPIDDLKIHGPSTTDGPAGSHTKLFRSVWWLQVWVHLRALTHFSAFAAANHLQP